jgi:YD repeat-containing protein
LAGIPITITRVYDTLQAGVVGDFGYGWSLGVQDAHIRETVPAGEGLIPDKTRVYLTGPDGKRVGFTYKEKYVSGFWGFGAVCEPYFVADPGVTSTLSVQGQVGRGGVIEGLSEPFNPDLYTLTTQDGTKYEYSQASGLKTITDRNGITVTFTKEGVTHSIAGSISFVRDSRGRITEIVGPAPTAGAEPVRVKYQYDLAGNLVKFTNQVADVTRYEYLTDPKHPHFLDKIFDSKNVKIFDAEFDDSGRLVGSTDALGNAVSQNFDLGSFTGTQTDANGNVTTLLYSADGNVTRKIDSMGGVTIYEYTDPVNQDKPTSVTDANGNTTRYTYDLNGNVLTNADPAGHQIASEYSSLSIKSPR